MYLLREFDINTGKLLIELYENYDLCGKDKIFKLAQKIRNNVLIMDTTQPVGYAGFKIIYSKWSV